MLSLPESVKLLKSSENGFTLSSDLSVAILVQSVGCKIEVRVLQDCGASIKSNRASIESNRNVFDSQTQALLFFIIRWITSAVNSTAAAWFAIGSARYGRGGKSAFCWCIGWSVLILSCMLE